MYIKIIIFSMLPITELRLSIPYFIIFEKLDWMTVVMLSVIGNIFIGFTIFYLIAPIVIFLSKNRYFKNIINYILDRTRSKSSLINNFKALGLVLFIGIPLPFTGVWTGSLAAYLFSCWEISAGWCGRKTNTNPVRPNPIREGMNHNINNSYPKSN